MADDIPQRVRKFCYERDFERCRWCGQTNAGLHLHHILYRSQGGKHVPENLVTLCHAHHALVHTNKSHSSILYLLITDTYRGVTGLQLCRWIANEQNGIENG